MGNENQELKSYVESLELLMTAKKDKKIDSDIGSFLSSTRDSDSYDSFLSTSTTASESSDTDDRRNIEDIIDKCDRDIEALVKAEVQTELNKAEVQTELNSYKELAKGPTNLKKQIQRLTKNQTKKAAKKENNKKIIKKFKKC